MRKILIGLCLFTISSACYAHECVPRFIPEAEFGPRDIGKHTVCAGLAPTEEQSCELKEEGVVYGVSEGLITNKEIVPETYSGRLPFGISWGDKLELVVRKIDVATKGSPPIFISSADDGYHLSTDTCLKTKSGSEYSSTFYFGKDRALNRIEGQILYP